MVQRITCFQTFYVTRHEADQTYVNDYKYILPAMNRTLQHCEERRKDYKNGFVSR